MEPVRSETAVRPFCAWSRSEDELGQSMSDFAHTPFELDGVTYGSIEGFYVSLVFLDPASQTPLGIRSPMVFTLSRRTPRRSLDLRRPPGRGRTMVKSDVASDQELVANMVAGDTTAFAVLERRMHDCVWTACLTLMGRNERLARDGFRAVWSGLAEASFKRCGAWRGREPFETFLTVKVRELLLEWCVQLFRNEDLLAKDIFVGLFDRPIRGWVAKRHRNDVDRADAYQTALAELFENDCRRLRAYEPPGNFANHVKVVVDNLLRDDLRRVIGRRRLPAAIEKLTSLEQDVFKAIYWNDTPANPDTLLLVIGAPHQRSTQADVEAACLRVQKVLPAGYIARPKDISIDAPITSGGDGDELSALVDTLPDEDGVNPLQAMLDREDDEQMQAALAAMKRAMDALVDEEDRLYIRLWLEGVEKPREIAKLMGISVNQVYVIKERVRRRLRASLAADADMSRRQTAREGDGHE